MMPAATAAAPRSARAGRKSRSPGCATTLSRSGMWGKADEERLLAEITLTIERAAETYLATPPQGIETIFDFTYQALPKDLAEQRRAALDAGGEVRPQCPRSRSSRRSTWRSPAPWPTTPRFSSSARTSAPKAASFARPRGCSTASGPIACSTRRSPRASSPACRSGSPRRVSARCRRSSSPASSIRRSTSW